MERTRSRWGFWRESFLNELPGISEFIDPEEPVVSGEEVIGEMSPFERAAATWLALKKQESAKTVQDAKSKGLPEEEIRRLTIEIRFLLAKMEVVKTILYISIHERLQIPWDKDVGIRQGFFVVLLPEESRPDIGEDVEPVAIAIHVIGRRKGASVPEWLKDFSAKAEM